MGRINLVSLRKAANGGSPDSKVAVNRRWLAIVLEELEELDRLREKTKNRDFVDKAGDALGDIFEAIFGNGPKS